MEVLLGLAPSPLAANTAKSRSFPHLLPFNVIMLRRCRLPEDEIEEKLAAYRTELLAKSAELAAAARERMAHETHAVAQRKQDQMERLRGAFGFGAEVKEGEAFDRELQEQRRLERRAERERVEKEREKAKLERERRCGALLPRCIV